MVIGQRRAGGGKIDSMPGYKSGAEPRRLILDALTAKQPQTIRGLAKVTGMGYSVAVHHLSIMERIGWVIITRRRGRLGSTVRLTDAGVTAARTV